MKKRLLISFSGGRTSAYMLWWILNKWEDRSNWEIVVVFANTGLEASGTLVFVHQCSWRWNIPIVWVEARHRDENGNTFSKKGWKVKHQVVDFFTAAKSMHVLPNGKWTWSPYEEMVSVLGIPSTNAPFCSDQLKRKAILSYMKSIGWADYYTAIGIRYDEPDRISNRAEKRKIIYPLYEHTVLSKYDILYWWATESDFDLKIRTGEGNCNNCWKKNTNLLVKNAKENPESYSWWQYITDTYGRINPRPGNTLKPPFNFYRGNKSPKDILNMAGMSREEIENISKSEPRHSCNESCEAF
jgi:hypothetical protein